MNNQKLRHAALVSAIVLAVSTPAFAQSSGAASGDSGGQTKAGATATTGTTSGTTSPAQGAMGATGKTNTTKGETTMGATGAASADTTRGAPDNTNSKVRTNADMNSWVKGYAGEHKGRISRQAYMDEMARRWDSMDRNHQGLTPAEVSRLTGKVDVDHSALPRTGSDVQAGNMGPTSVKGK